MRGWAVGVVVANQVHDDPEPAEDGVIKGSDLVACVLGVDEDVSGAVIGLRGEDWIIAGRNPHHDITDPRVQRVANKPPPLRPPGVGHLAAQLAGY